MVALPAATAVSMPVLLTVATAELDEDQVTELLRLRVLPSLYVPVAVSCCMSPGSSEMLSGAIEIETNVTLAVTISPVLPVTLPDVASIVVAPVAAAVASPEELIVATAGFAEFQVTMLVRSTVEPLLYVPVAVYC